MAVILSAHEFVMMKASLTILYAQSSVLIYTVYATGFFHAERVQ